MKKVIYCKYNVNRAQEFQTKTIIYQDGTRRYIEKYALTDFAQQHMDAFENNFHLTEKLYPAIRFIPSERVGKGIRYPYIVGKPVDEVLRENIHRWEDVLPELRKMIGEIYISNAECRQKFVMTEGFGKIFGDVDCSDDVCICPCNLDVIFDNLMLVGEQITAFDYEWVYNFPIPEKYVLYRVLCRFYDKYLHYLKHHFTFEEYLSEFDFSTEEKVRYRKMEDAFIRYIYANGDPVYQNNKYKHKRTSLDEVKRLENQLSDAMNAYNGVIEVLHNTEREYLRTIDRLNEAARLKQEADAIIERQRRILAPITKPLQLCERGVSSIKNDGFKKSFQKLKNKLYNKNILKDDKNLVNVLLPIIEVSVEEQAHQRKMHFEHEYKISIVTPLFNTPEEFLVELLESVKSQTYDNWEFCLVNFSTTDFERVNKTCQEYAKSDQRISYHVANENRGIAENTNICISYATGDYIGLLDHDDILHPCALYEVVKAINEMDADFVYTDEVKFSEGIQNVFLPNFKPDFSMDELRAHNYICHFNVYKKDLYHEVGGYRNEFDGSQDHDIVLRLTEKAKQIVHIPKILYYWRVHPNSVAQSIDAKSYATDAGAAAVTEQLKRAGEKQFAESVINHIPLYRIRTELEQSPDVTVIIWNGKNERLVKKSIKSLGELQKCKIIVLNEDTRNLSDGCNSIMESVNTKYALFLCAGLELHSETLANEIMIYARRKDIATIDCKVLTDDNTIFSGGAYLSGDSGMPVKLRCMGGSKDYSGYENGMLHSRNVTMSTGLCTFVDVDIWKHSEGVSNIDSMNWMIEYSYKMWKSGKNNLWIPFIEAVGMEKELHLEYISALCELKGQEYDERDAYVSEYISKLHLE